jgi:tryptophanyl-tRNA synthetase
MARYGDFKKIVADEMAQFLADFQARLANVDDAAILAKLETSERAMNDVANATLLRVQKAVGLRK